MQALLLLAFRVLKLQQLIIRCEPENVCSRVIPERLGFVNEGLMRNVVKTAEGDPASVHRYSMLAEEFEDCATCATWTKGELSFRAFDALGRAHLMTASPVADA